MLFNFKQITTKCINISARRFLMKTSKLRIPSTYDGDGKTTVHIMNTDEYENLMIDAFSEVGFRLNNNLTILGPMVIFPRSVLSWNIINISDVNEHSLSLMKILEPKIDILIIGTGEKNMENNNVHLGLLPFSRKYKISLEILPTETACSTFNFLNAEGRNVIGALIPPKTISATDDDTLNTKLRYHNLYEMK